MHHVDVDRVRNALAKREYQAMSSAGHGRFAAVAAILRAKRHGAEVLLIRRARHDADPWSGHMAFPGGRQEPGDLDLLGTAIRETEEEVGLRLGRDTHCLGRLDDLPAIARGRPVGLVIAPFVFAVAEDPDLVPNAAEVEELVWAPLSALARGEHDTTYAYEFEGRKISLPGYDVNGRIVWGLTHRMLEALFRALDSTRRESYGAFG